MRRALKPLGALSITRLCRPRPTKPCSFEVKSAGIAKLTEHQPEVVLLDIGMQGLDGYETCQRIRRVLGSPVLLVALTGYGQEQDKERATRAGFDAHLTKPADAAAVAGIVALAPRAATRKKRAASVRRRPHN